MEFYKSRIEQMCAQFYMQYLSDSPSDKILYTANTYLPRMRSQLPPPQGEQEATVLANRVANKIHPFMAQIYDVVSEFPNIYYIGTETAPEDMQNSLRQMADDFINTTCQEMLSRVQRSLVLGDPVWMMNASLWNLFEQNANRFISRSKTIRERMRSHENLLRWSKDGHKLFRFNAVLEKGNCSTCFGHYGKTYTMEQILEKDILPPLHPNCKCSLEPADKGNQWYTPILRIPGDAKATFQAYLQDLNQKWNSGWIGKLDVMTWGYVLGNYQRGMEAWNNPNSDTIFNYLASGIPESILRMEEGTFRPEEPLSLEHWMDSAGFAATLYAGYQMGKRAAPLYNGKGYLGGGPSAGRAVGASKGTSSLKPQNLLDELAESGVKYNPEDVIAVTKTVDGKLVWLEKGNEQSGLKHIVNSHAINFSDRGITDIPAFLNRVVSTNPIKTGSNAKGLFAEYVVNGNKYRVAYGTNGYIVSFYPVD